VADNVNHINFLDIVRVLCTLWIVGYWHLQDYDVLHITLFDGAYFITTSVLVCFFFISGLLNSKKADDIKAFYKNRFSRLYILYLVALFISTMQGIQPSQSFKFLVFSSLGLSGFCGPQPITLWFIANLLFFYLITPFVTKLSHCLRKFGGVYVTLSIFIIFFCAYKVFDGVDKRLAIYAPYYFLGVFLNKEHFKHFMNSKIVLIMSTLMLVIIGIFSKSNGSIYIIHLISTIGAIGILSIGVLLSKSKFIVKLCVLISYASMCAYLFHRSIYALFISCDREFVGSFFCPIVMILILFMCSFTIQLIYDKLILLVNYIKFYKK